MPDEQPTPSGEVTASAGKEPLLATPKVEPNQETPPKEGDITAKEGGNEAPKEGEGKKEEPKKIVPEKYELKLPKDSKLNAAHLEKVATFAKERGFSQEEAQAFLERDNAIHSEALANYEKSFQRGGEGWNQLLDTYEQQGIEDKEIGGSIENLTKHAELARRVVERFDSKDKALSTMLSESPVGSHPAVIRFLSTIGKAMSDDKMVWGDPGNSKPKSPAEILYGSSEK